MLNKHKIQEQIDLLLKYQNEYLVKLNSQITCGIFGFELKNYDFFISSLIKGVRKQKRAMIQYEQQYHKYFTLWEKHQYKLKMWKTIVLKLLKHDLRMMKLEEQIQTDEYVQKSFLTKK
ncbi:MAG: flagellar FliJ family protein [Buchnera aphidicola (Meitanaphis flavogallis)]